MSWRRLHIHMSIMEAKRWQTPAAPEGPHWLIMGSAGVSLILPGKSDGICAGGLIYADCFGPIAAYLQCVLIHCIRDFWLHLHRIISRHHIASITPIIGGSNTHRPQDPHSDRSAAWTISCKTPDYKKGISILLAINTLHSSRVTSPGDRTLTPPRYRSYLSAEPSSIYEIHPRSEAPVAPLISLL